MTYLGVNGRYAFPIRYPNPNGCIHLEKELAWANLKIQVLEERLRFTEDQEVRSGSEKPQRCATEPAGTRAWSEQRRGPGGEPTRAAAGSGEEGEKSQTSGTAGVAAVLPACGARDRLHAGTVRLQGLRTTHGGDRLRRQ